MKNLSILLIFSLLAILGGCYDSAQNVAEGDCSSLESLSPAQEVACMRGVAIARYKAQNELHFYSTRGAVLRLISEAKEDCQQLREAQACVMGVELFKRAMLAEDDNNPNRRERHIEYEALD